MRKKKVNKENFAEELNAAIAATLKTTLESILKTDFKKPSGANGREETDYELTARTMKSQARVALDLIANIKKKDEE